MNIFFSNMKNGDITGKNIFPNYEKEEENILYMGKITINNSFSKLKMDYIINHVIIIQGLFYFLGKHEKDLLRILC